MDNADLIREYTAYKKVFRAVGCKTVTKTELIDIITKKAGLGTSPSDLEPILAHDGDEYHIDMTVMQTVIAEYFAPFTESILDIDFIKTYVGEKFPEYLIKRADEDISLYALSASLDDSKAQCETLIERNNALESDRSPHRLCSPNRRLRYAALRSYRNRRRRQSYHYRSGWCRQGEIRGFVS